MSEPALARPLPNSTPRRWSLRCLGLRTRFLLLFYLIALGATTLVGWYGYQSAAQAYRGKAVDLAQGYVKEVSLQIDNFIDLAQNDLAFIADNYALQRHSYWMDIGDVEKREWYHQILADTLRGFARAYPYNFKLRLINPDGQEHISVRRDPVTGAVRVIPDQEMQNKGDRDYFKETMALVSGEVYVSPLDLNQEGGRIETPHIPVVRVAAPLLGANQVRYGVVVNNILANAFFDFIRQANNNPEGRRFYLIDAQGNYLFHPEEGKAFGHLLGHGTGLESEFPGLLEQLKGRDEGLLTVAGRIIAFQAIHPGKETKEPPWLLLGVVPEAVALAELNRFAITFGLIALGVFLLALLATRYFLAGLMGPLGFVTRQMQRLSRGEVAPESLDYPAQDELHEMLDATQTLMANSERLALRADAIGGGDLSQEVELLSERDRLGAALNRMTRQLRAARAEDARRAWVKDGLGQLSAALTGDLGPQSLADTAIGLLGRYLGAGRGVLYHYRPDEQALDLLGSYMFTERTHPGNRYKLGEGAVGQVAREHKPIALTAVVADSAPVATGTTHALPFYTYTWPLLRDNELLGVLELGGFEHFDELKLEFLNAAAELIAAFLYMAAQRENIQRLLAISEAAERAAREQSLRLQEANAQMEEQQQQLQQQSEELQQSNAQMEEQQQQLQQQTEELQQTNAQMEETQVQLQQQTRDLQRANAQMEEQQQQLEQLNRELTRSQRALDDKAQMLEQSSRYKSEFLANMSHELRTPLNSIILLSKMMAQNDLGHLQADDVKQAEVIHRSGQELLRLINDVLDLSKIEAGRMEVHLAPVASADLINELREQFEHAARDKGLTLGIEDRLQGEFVSDHDKLAQVLRNLLSNALKFTKQGGVRFSLERRAGDRLPIRLQVRDTGIGIPSDKQTLVFEAFRQADGSTSREFGGTGLGLSISQRFAHLLGGTIELESALGQGSTFTLCLPEQPTSPGKAVAAHPARPQPQPVPEPPTVPAADAKPDDDRERITADDRVILLIDDDRAFGQAVVQINHRLGYKTLLAGAGAEGLELARHHHPTGILLDLGLPDMDGIQVLHQLKVDPELAAIPVYVVSARDRDAARLDETVVGYLQKPVNDRQIAEAESAVFAALAKARGGAGGMVLVLERGGISAAEITELTGLQRLTGIDLNRLPPAEMETRLAAALATEAWRLAIIDLDGHPLEQGLALARGVRERLPEVALLFFSDRPLGEEEEARLRHYSDSILVRAPHAERRLADNIERFLREAPTTRAQVESETVPGQRLAGRHVLVVDDDPRNLFVITAALERHGARVSNAINGRRALELLTRPGAEGPPDLVLMDVMMPEMDGYQTIAQLRASPALARLPIVALTAKALPGDREKVIAAGADDYLAKPADYEVLINLVAAWCGGGKAR